MKIDDVHDYLDLISNNISNLKEKVLILNSWLEDDITDGFNKYVCKSLLIVIDSFMDNSEDIINDLATLKTTILNMRDRL